MNISQGRKSNMANAEVIKKNDKKRKPRNRIELFSIVADNEIVCETEVWL